MSPMRLFGTVSLVLAAVLAVGAPAAAQVRVQCPGDVNGDAIPDYCLDGEPPNPSNGKCNGNDENPDFDPNVQCLHLSSGDGFSVMADGYLQYIFGFADMTGIKDGDFASPDGDLSDDVMTAGALAAAWPAPSIVVDEGKEFYLSLTNVGMMIRPDLFDPHTVHFHGFPQSSTVFDGLPESGIAINMGATLTYYYNLVEPGTYMYHCHVEATEHMQMGMLGSLYVRARQSFEGDPLNGIPAGTLGGNTDAGAPLGYAYNDGDGSTAYDVEYPIQLGGFDPDFHDASLNVQPLPFAMMWDRYPMINGRGYPDTANPDPLPAPAENGGIESQVEHALITAQQGDQVLLRISNLNIVDTHNMISPSIPMRVVGIDAKELMDADGNKLHYTTSSVALGGGMSVDVILDTTGIAPGDYYLYAGNYQFLANYDEPGFATGGMMTKIVVQ